ncbi:hypothetical protein M407DRAFT_25141 [Tulasnella calospora MUT 4182]|uniref:Uncharacterized protein n=1 Tax=Tulasnella calospora MUT 4182 TaxID=1051891 RepID=A0A0C3KVM2_9AGAM|nr:hypothetical protein M407DRAFT_25141 [Tulasnella calospora MUT 4182]
MHSEIELLLATGIELYFTSTYHSLYIELWPRIKRRLLGFGLPRRFLEVAEVHIQIIHHSKYLVGFLWWGHRTVTSLVAATYRDISRDNSSDGGLQLPDDVISEIRAIVNTRYQQMIKHPFKQVYLATFFLDPRESLLSFSTNKAELLIITLALSSGYARSAIMAKKNPNPIAGRSVHLRVSKDPDTAETDTHGDADLRETFPAYIESGKYLFSALQKEINGDKVPAVFVKFADSDATLDTFR